MWIRVCFFFNDTATTEIYTLSLHDALPIFMDDDAYDLAATGVGVVEADNVLGSDLVREGDVVIAMASSGLHSNGDRKSTRLNSSHANISYAVFCLKKKKSSSTT